MQSTVRSIADLAPEHVSQHIFHRPFKPVAEADVILAQVAFIEDTREQYSEMRDEFFASLEDRRYLTISEARSKGLKVCYGLYAVVPGPLLQTCIEDQDWQPITTLNLGLRHC